MVKKEYVKPEMVVEQFMAEIAFLNASTGDDDNKQDWEEGETDGRGANDHRGSWGDLWN